jgi:hypothetical protein
MSFQLIKNLTPSPIIIDVHHQIAPDVFIDKYKNLKFERDPSLPPV